MLLAQLNSVYDTLQGHQREGGVLEGGGGGVGIVGYEHESGCAWVCGCVGVPAVATYSQLAMSVDTSADMDTQTDTHTH